jgi:large subunit ribosomal protein L20
MHKDKILDLAKGFHGRAKNCYRIAVERVQKGLQYQYRDRKVKKREFRALWIQRINAGAREHGLRYGEFMNGLTKANIELDRKALADMAVTEPASFKSLVQVAADALKRVTGMAAPAPPAKPQ